MQGFRGAQATPTGISQGRARSALGMLTVGYLGRPSGWMEVVVHRSEILILPVTPGTSATILIASLSSNTSHAGYQDAVTFRSSSGKAPKTSY